MKSAQASIQIGWQLPRCGECHAQVSAHKEPSGIFADCPNRRWYNFWSHFHQQLSWEKDERFLKVGEFHIDRNGMFYNFFLYFGIGWGLMAYHWFDGWAKLPAYISELSSWVALGQLVTQWQKEKFRKS